jgi:uncharacterized protein (TIGR04255 family)
MTSKRKSVGKRRIKFQHPPIDELVIGIRYVPVAELKAQHIGLYWESIRNRFPNCEQQPPVLLQLPGQPPTQLPDAPGEIFPLPRFWFFSSAHRTLVQIQRNAFWLNWRHGSTGDYPHYENVERDFWQEFGQFETFIQGIGGKVDVVQSCELTYINLIGPNAFFSSPAEIGNVFPSVASLSEVHSEVKRLVGINASATYEVTNNLLVGSTIRLGKRLDSGELVAVLELKAQGTPSDLSLTGAREWFKVAHDGIYELFLNVTDKKVQTQVWKPL